MPIPAKTLDDLGWPRLIAQWAQRSHTTRGEAAIASAEFFAEPEEAENRVAEIAEARDLIALDAPLPFGGIKDVVTAVDRADKGGVLDAGELLAVADTGRGLGRLRKHLTDHEGEAPRLLEQAVDIADLRHVYEPIAGSFAGDGTLADHASEALGPLRRKLAQLRNQLEGRMHGLVDDPRYSRHLQDRYFTTRDDRYVVPVRVEARSQVRGIIHGTSQSGQTVFVEPDEIVELNNRVKLAECDVDDEEQRILAELSGRVAAEADTFRAGIAAATALDVIAAAAVLAVALDASPPVIDAGGRLSLTQARHPLMVLPGRECVPNDIELASGSILILSGPNAGGKTVALKTAGMAALMVRAGLHIAALPDSRVPWFGSVESDIGDSQSIENDLSTFSGHLVKLRQYLQEAGPRTLLLIDEIAVGTEPEQGAALAQAVLEALAERRVPAIVTTHYERLKALGAGDERFANASVGFDLDTMEPTFELHLGVPGSSGALAVARRMGVPGAVVDRAQSLMGERRASIEELLAEVSDERRKLAAERAQLAELLREAEVAKKRAEVARDSARDYEQRLKQGAHTEAVAALRAARDELDEVRSRVKRRTKQSDMGAAKKRISELATAIAEHAPAPARPPGREATPADLVPGAEVFVTGLGATGVVVGQPERGKVTVQVGTMRSQVATTDLRIQPGKPAPAKAPGDDKAPPRSSGRARSRRAQPEIQLEDGRAGDRTAVRTPDVTIDVRGQRADEAVDSVDRFIDHCLLAMRDLVFVIHGHGTGALRSAIRGHLEGHHAVTSWRAGERSEGGDGVTVAWLAHD